MYQSEVPALGRSPFSREKAHKGRLWLLFSLCSQPLLDSVMSLVDIRSSYYTPSALICTNIGWAFITAMLKQLHTITFRLSPRTDMQYFDQVNRKCLLLCILSDCLFAVKPLCEYCFIFMTRL